MSAVVSPSAAPSTPAPTPPPVGPGPRPWTFTREQFDSMGELGFFRGRRAQLVFGVIVEEGPMNWPHARAVGRVGNVLRAVFAAGHWVSEQRPFAADESLPLPDVAVYTGSMDDYTDHPTVAALVVEVADSSLNFDMTTKAELYATAGVPDYWVLDLEGRRLLVYRNPAPLLGATAYRSHAAFGPADTLSPLAAPGATVAVADLLP